MMLEKAVNGLKGSYINKSATDVKEITGVDAVSGATYSSNAIRDAILNALELKQEEEAINLPTEKLAEGEIQRRHCILHRQSKAQSCGK